MRVTRGTWTARNAELVVALAIALAILLWVQLAGSGAGSANAVVGPSYPVRGHLAAVRSDRPGLRVLFVGNSLTYTYDIPSMVEGLAAQDPGAPPIFAGGYLPSGWRLELAARDPQLKKGIAEYRWDDVVLQEQSATPSLPGYRDAHMFPPAQRLAELARKRGARTLLFMTWGYRDGDPLDYNQDSYSAMQSRVADGYIRLSALLHAPVAAAGYAWQTALAERPATALWGPDGHHPSLEGSYLAACVLYGRLTGRDPRGSAFAAGLDPSEALWLRQVAAQTPPEGY